MKQFLPLATIMVASFLLPASATDRAEIKEVESRIQRLGINFQWMRTNTGICARRGLQGLYVRPKRTIVICQQAIRDHKNSVIDTLKHEGWHAVQHLCTDSKPVKSKSFVDAGLSEADKYDLSEFYSRDMRALEAEARAIEHLSLYAYLDNVNHFCSS